MRSQRVVHARTQANVRNYQMEPVIVRECVNTEELLAAIRTGHIVLPDILATTMNASSRAKRLRSQQARPRWEFAAPAGRAPQDLASTEIARMRIARPRAMFRATRLSSKRWERCLQANCHRAADSIITTARFRRE